MNPPTSTPTSSSSGATQLAIPAWLIPLLVIAGFGMSTFSVVSSLYTHARSHLLTQQLPPPVRVHSAIDARHLDSSTQSSLPAGEPPPVAQLRDDVQSTRRAPAGV
ncbi:hypothetical protein PISMIDRAFT_15923 [Pisolithus microcarpus 441]|uniref:Uncharacterized protein n=1 Tax=Pisolithus microcarpus 441 TaxID=765257 RepID=A0A0C9Z8R8_9AGAM|nr:hypothetical protein PISMIDRAFT_15923 [Pisolithus microcarpus 441]